MMTKVLVILGGLGREGITNSVLTYLERIDKENIEIHLGIAGKTEEDLLERAKKIKIPLHILPGRNTKPINYFFELIRIVKRYQFDIVHVHGNSATLGIDMLAAKLGGAPIRISHSRNTACTHPMYDRFMRPLFNMTYTDGFACGEEAGKWMFGDKPFTVIPNGKDLNRYMYNPVKREEIRREYNVGDKIVLGHVGIFTKQKNHKFLIEIFKEICRKSNNYELWLMGEGGECRDDLEEKIIEYGLSSKVKILGFKTNIEDYLNAMDIMVFPSLYEGVPNVVVEWQISGLPCIISDRITRECGVMESVKYTPLELDATEWADLVLKTSHANRTEGQDIIRKRMAEAGFDINENVIKLKQLYMQLGERKKSK